MKDQIPEEFYKYEGDKPAADNVGELIEQLKKLPSGLPVEATFSDGVQLAVYNIDQENPHLMFEEKGQ